MTRDIFATTFSRGPRDCCRGPRLRFWPKMFMFSGRSILDFISGGCSDPSLNVTCILVGLRTSNEADALKDDEAKGLDNVTEFTTVEL